jgi:hypothetical protein
MKFIIPGVLAIVLTGGVSLAQVQEPSAPPDPGQQTAPVSQADLQKFAEIYVDVTEVRNKMSLEMSEASSQEQAQEIQRRMQEATVAAISERGWSVERYNDVANAISNDPELRTKAVDLINELSSS